jgi:hypothetical protein
MEQIPPPAGFFLFPYRQLFFSEGGPNLVQVWCNSLTLRKKPEWGVKPS